MILNPNFPPNLSITPNAGTLDGVRDDDGGDVFGVKAQREAIARYGIAGRVWEAAYALCAYVEGHCQVGAFDFDPPFVDLRCDANDAGSGAPGSPPPLGVIELGSGTGVVAASIARAIRQWRVADTTAGWGTRGGGFVVATDLPDVCPLLQHNLGIPIPRPASEGADAAVNNDTEDSDAARVTFVRPLAWGDLAHACSIATEFGLSFLAESQTQSESWSSQCEEVSARRLTHIVCSDLVYFPELFGPLLRTLIHLTSPPPPSSFRSPPTKIVISYKIRSLAKETPFWAAFGLWFSFWPVLARRRQRAQHIHIDESENEGTSLVDDTEPWRRFGADESSDRTFVFVAHRRPESMAWVVPEADRELMDGMGAQGTPAKKVDDTFETVLFMDMGMDNTDK